MRLVVLALLPLTAGCWSVGLTEEEAREPWVNRLAVGYGELTMNEKDEYPSTEELETATVDYTWTKAGAWFGYEAAIRYANDDHDESDPTSILQESEVEVAEADFGLRKTWLLWDLTLHPYVGGGAAALYGRRKLDLVGGIDVEDEEWTPALYFHAGFDWHFWKNVFLGFDFRILREDFINEGDLDLDYDAFTVRLGLTF